MTNLYNTLKYVYTNTRAAGSLILLVLYSNNYAHVTNLPLTSTLHSMMRYLIVSSFPSLTASPSGVSPSLVTAPILVSQTVSGMQWRIQERKGGCQTIEREASVVKCAKKLGLRPCTSGALRLGKMKTARGSPMHLRLA